MYNDDAKPPYDLPAEKTKSTLKSNSSKGGGGFNELRFEDKKGEEQIYFHAEKNFDRVVENDDTLKVGFDTKDPGSPSGDRNPALRCHPTDIARWPRAIASY